MDVIAILRAAVCRSLLGFLVILTLLATPAFSVEYQDSQIFISGFNAYQSKNYQGAIDNMSSLLEKYPDSPLRDMALFWLARAHFKAGHNKDAAQYMAQFFREYPDSPLKGTVEPELTKLANAYAKGQPIPATGVIAATEAKKPVETAAAATATAANAAAAEKAAAEKAAVAKLAEAEEKAAAEKAAMEKAAAEKATAEKAAIEKAAAEKAAMEKAATEKAAMEKAAAEKAAAEKAAIEKAAAEKAAMEKAAAEKAAAESAAAEKAAAEKATSEKAEFERLAMEKAEAEKAWERRVAEEKAAAEKTAAKKAAAEKRAEERVDAKRAKAERAAARKAAAERIAAEKAAARKAAAEEAEAAKEARARERAMAAEVRKAESMATMQEKAIAGYKAVIDRYPGTQAAITAAGKLRKMGIVYGAQAPVFGTTVAQAPMPPENSQVINLEVAQFADFAFNVAPAGQSYLVGKRFTIPFEIVNRGNGADSFSLESGFPAEFDAQFAPESATSSQMRVTQRLAPGEKFKGVLTAVIPNNSIDGQKFSFPIKAYSQFTHDFSQSRVITLTASAPLLRAVIKPDKSTVLPNGKVAYRIALLNVGSADANGLTMRLSYPPMTEPVDATAAGFRQEVKGVVVVDGLKVSSGESKDFSVTFQVKDDAPARQGLVLRGDVINNDLDTKESFLSTVTTVEGLSGVAAKGGKDNLQIIPGQTVTIPVVVTNTGNMRDSYLLRPDVPSGISCRFYQDLKRDGIKQAGAPSVNSTGALEPRENAYLLMEVGTQSSAADGSSATVGALFESESDRAKSASVSVSLHFARPIVELSMIGQGGKLKPGEVSSFDLNVTNRGSNLAKSVEVQSVLPDNLEMMASDLQSQAGPSGEYIWKFPELGAGEKRSIRVTFRVRSGIPVGTNIQIRNLVTYEDQLGNRY